MNDVKFYYKLRLHVDISFVLSSKKFIYKLSIKY